jgi:tetratricopeptide (TPR) repeat protein
MHCYLRRNRLLLAVLPAMAFALLCEPAEAFWRLRRARRCCTEVSANTASCAGLDTKKPSTEETELLAEIRGLTCRVNCNPRDLDAFVKRGGAFFNLYDLHSEERFLTSAFADLSRALRIDPRSTLAWEGLGYVYMYRHDYAAAVKALDQAVLLGGKTFTRVINRGISNWWLEQNDEALTDFTQAIELDGKDAEARSQRGQLLYGAEKYDRAIEDFAKAIELEPKKQIHRSWRAAGYFAIAEVDKAVDDIWAAIRLNVDDSGNTYEPRTNKALSPEALAHGQEQVRKMLHDRPAMAEGISEGNEIWTWAVRKFGGEDSGYFIDWDSTAPSPLYPSDAPLGHEGEHAAIRVRKESLDASTRDASFEEMWVCAVFELHNAAAREQFLRSEKRATEGAIQRDDFILAWLDCEERTAQKTRATYLSVFLPWMREHDLDSNPHTWHCYEFFANRGEFINAVKLDPRWKNYGVGYDLVFAEGEFNRGHYAKSESLLKKVLANKAKLSPEDVAQAEYWLGFNRWYQSDLKGAIAEFDKAVAADPGQHSRYARGQALFEIGETKKAIDDFTKIIEADADKDSQDTIDALDYRGYGWVQEEEYDKAIADFDESIRRNGSRAYPFGARGEAKYRKGELDTAVADLSEGIRLEPANARFWLMRGFAYEGKEAWSQASADYRHAAALDPTDAYAHNALAWILATCPDPKIRDGRAALSAATRACGLTKWKVPQPIDTLACALAETGRFREASARMRMAISLGSNEDEATQESWQAHLKTFERRQAHRVQAGK